METYQDFLEMYLICQDFLETLRDFFLFVRIFGKLYRIFEKLYGIFFFVRIC